MHRAPVGPTRRTLLLGILLGAFALLPGGCRVEREPTATLDYRNDIQPLLQAHCSSCHGAERSEASWRADSYVATIGCVTGNRPASSGAAAPILAVLGRDDHRGLLTYSEQALLARWVAEGAPAGRGVHESAFLDPRSAGSHGAYLRAKRYRPLLDPEDPLRCARCHEGAAAPATSSAAPGASACTSCHAEGVLSCGTCHGTPGAAYPPRDRCFFPDDPVGAHAVHIHPTVQSDGIACSTCHPVPNGPGVFDGAHADGVVEVWFDRQVVPVGAIRDGSCTGTCHARGGARPAPHWNGEAPMGCNDCHGAPPAGHYAGPCTGCHSEANADGTALVATRLHLNGRVDRGDGSGTCSACHGHSGDPWPTTGAHQAHAHPEHAAPVACATCHAVPAAGDPHPLGGGASVRFAGLALASSYRPTFDPVTRTCAQTYCHQGRGGTTLAPRWEQGPSASACGTCHAAPPPPPHTQASQCSSTGGCHSGSTNPDGSFTSEGAARHVDGTIDRGP